MTEEDSILLGVAAVARLRSTASLNVHHSTEREHRTPCVRFAGVGTFSASGEVGGGFPRWPVAGSTPAATRKAGCVGPAP